MFRRFVVALVLTVWLFPPPAARAEPPPPPPGAATRTAGNPSAAAGGVPGTPDEVRSLAQRERQAQQLQDFEGGGRISIGTTTLIIILLLVIILVLIL